MARSTQNRTPTYCSRFGEEITEHSNERFRGENAQRGKWLELENDFTRR
jgi:hypothetical protein